ncbi:hypothetical protein ACFXD5_11790 [Streptomyces sp. NPDC059385]|uniref:hypothetical protein n=1 Tax=Streptomyces sp. NPDC059385 TaxID=3346817 RepID=UPI003685D76B
MVRRLRRQLGRRGTILSCYGIVWILYGFGQLVTPQPDQRGLTLALSVFPLVVWGWLWIVAGIIAMACAWAPPGRDAAGFIVLVLIALPWMVTYLAAWITRDLPRGWVAAAIWMLICIPIMVVAGWPEAPRRKRAEAPYEC